MLPQHKKPIGIYKVKYNVDGTLKRFKAQFVPKG